MRRRAKVVCTLGPAVATADAVEALVRAGMDVARLNLSHGTHASHRDLYEHVRRASDATGRAVAVLADLQGPKIRLGAFTDGPVELVTGASFVLTAEPVEGTVQRASTSHAALPDEVRPGDTILLSDGLVRLEVERVDGAEVTTRVIEGGPVDDHKGVNLPGGHTHVVGLSAKDDDDLRFALALGVDLVALSFVRDPGDVVAVHAVMDAGGRRAPVLAKLEKPEAVERLDEILDAFDGVLIARGDLGIELPLEDVPLIQRRTIDLARAKGKPVIVATQMLESMMEHSRPTRAEVSDVANAVFDGADALMLSGETSAGRWPHEAIRTMVKVIEAAEAGPDHDRHGAARAGDEPTAIAAAAVSLARDLGSRAVVAFTQTGATARRLAAHRPPLPLLAFTPSAAVRRELALTWGVESFVVPPVGSTDDMVRAVDSAMLELDHIRPGDRVVVVAGSPPGGPGNTDTIRVHRVARP